MEEAALGAFWSHRRYLCEHGPHRMTFVCDLAFYTGYKP